MKEKVFVDARIRLDEREVGCFGGRWEDRGIDLLLMFFLEDS